MQEKEIKTLIGGFFRNKRKGRKISVNTLSELTGIHMGAIAKLERGITDMKFTNVLKIIAVLKIDANDLAIYGVITAKALGVDKNEHTF
jgi:transcriptional regulator with XRE-family HTH domain